MSPARLTLASALVLGLAACDEEPFDRNAQIGPDPKLPEQNQYLVPPMRLAPVVRWNDGATPSVPPELRVQAFATGLAHPRFVYTLPNGDVLAVEAQSPGIEPTERPKDLVMDWMQSYASGGASPGPTNRITLLRDADGDGTPEVRTLFIDHLNSPYGVALVGGDLYVAATDALLRFPYREGETSITEPPTVLTELPGGPIDHHWTKSLAASPDGSKLYVGVGSNSNIVENGLEAERWRAAIWEVDRARAPIGSTPAACAIPRPWASSPRPRNCGRW